MTDRVGRLRARHALKGDLARSKSKFAVLVPMKQNAGLDASGVSVWNEPECLRGLEVLGALLMPKWDQTRYAA